MSTAGSILTDISPAMLTPDTGSPLQDQFAFDFAAVFPPKNEGNLTKTYGGHRQKLLDILTDLRNAGIPSEIDLPQIAVLGSQSAGKSSLIESMSGISLPRASGTCTRCPMECHLQASDSFWKCTVSLRFDYDMNDQLFSPPRIVKFGPALTDQVQVKRVLEKAQRAILHPWITPSDFLAEEDGEILSDRPSLTFSKNCVCVKVEGKGVPDLLFYDLPGIIANVVDGGNPRDITLIRELAQSYINKDNCIILLVTSCETDFENQGAGSLVLRDPRLKKRTVGVLTKVDRIPEDDGDKWAAILQGRSNALPHGWFAVKMPDSTQLKNGVTWEEARRGETNFFGDNGPWCDLPPHNKQRLGSSALAEYLGSLLSDLFLNKLPRISTIIKSKLVKVKKELLQNPEPDYGDANDEVHLRIRHFLKDVEKHTRGLALASSAIHTPDPFRAGLIQTLHGAYDSFSLEVHRTAPQFYPWSSRNQNPDQSWLTEITKDDAPNGRVGDVHHIDEVMMLAKKSRTRELPGIYPFAVRLVLIEEAQSSWTKLAAKFSKEVDVVLVRHLERLMKDHFGMFEHGGFWDAIRFSVLTVIKELFSLTEKKVEHACEAEHDPWTQNDEYFFSCRDKFIKRYRMIYRASSGSQVAKLIYDTANGKHYAINDAIAALANLGIHNLGRLDLAKLLPADEYDPALEIMAEVRAYFQVAFRRFVDEIPNQIDASFIRPLGEALDIALTRMARQADKTQCGRWLQESPDRTNQREGLRVMQDRLEAVIAKVAPLIEEMVVSNTDDDGEETQEEPLPFGVPLQMPTILPASPPPLSRAPSPHPAATLKTKRDKKWKADGIVRQGLPAQVD